MDTITTHPYARRGADGLAQIGATRADVVGIRFIEGEGAVAAGDAGNTAKQNQQQNDQQSPPWGDDKSKFDPDKAWTLIQNVKGDLAAEKAKTDQKIADAVTAAEKNILGNIAKALGGGEEQETDPAKLNASLTDLTSKLGEKDTALTDAAAQIKAGQVALQVAIHAPALGGNTALLLANEKFKTSIASVEPTDEAAVKAAITQALQDNAALKQPPARSGDVTHTGPTVQSLEAQLKAAEEKKDVAASISLKRQIAAARSGQ